MTRWAIALFGAVAAGGCALGGLDDVSAGGATQNECKQDSDCGEGGVCSSGACQASTAKFDTVLLEVTPPANNGEYGGVRFLTTQTGMIATSHLELSLGEVPQVYGTITPVQACDWQFVEQVDGAEQPLEVGATGSIPVKITLTPTERLLGLSATSYTARTKLGRKLVDADTSAFDGIADCAGESDCEQWFSLRVPPGDYDVYIEPAEEVGECAVAPQLLLGQTVKAGDVEMPLLLPAPRELALTIRWQSLTGSLQGWTVDMVDPTSGRRLSSAEQLTVSVPSVDVPDTSEYLVTLAYQSVRLGGENYGDGQELVRLAPPEGVPAPTVLLERATLELFSVGDAQVDALKALPEVVTVEGFVESQATSEPVSSGTITFVATDIASDALEPGTLVSYVQTAELTPEGKFSVQLLPGSYKVQTVPNVESGLAAQERTLDVGVGSGVQAGMLVQLDDSAELSGNVVVPSGSDPLVGASVHASASPRKVKVSLLESVLRGQPLVPRATSDVVSGDGSFTLLADPGVFDVSVRPPEGTGFAWLVRPNVPVSNDRTNDLGAMKMPLPVSYTGTVSASGGRVLPSALVRAYLFMGTDGYVADRAAAKSVVQIAETRADDEGNFSLLLPSHLNP